jgi:hypothetical protein
MIWMRLPPVLSRPLGLDRSEIAPAPNPMERPVAEWPSRTRFEGLGAARGKNGQHPIRVGDQDGWFHDEGHPYGYFNTFDQIRLPGSKPRKVLVLLPRDYKDSGRRYPVVYMNDGDTAFFPGGLGHKSWKVAEALGALSEAGLIEPVIVVGVCPLQRGIEYTHGGGDRMEMRVPQYSDYLADSVKRFVDANYRTDPDPLRTAIVGSSHGGLAAFFTGTRRPDAFHKIGALSSSFWYGLDRGTGNGGALVDSALFRAARPTLSDPARRPELWIDWGMVRSGGHHNEVIEMLAARRSAEMVGLLTSEPFGYTAGRDLFAVEDPRGEHDENSWARRFIGLMLAFYPRAP